MSLPELCIRRPVLATVISLALLMFGLVGYSRLPVREMPDIEIPIVSVSTVLPGASPEVVETEITEPLEEELNGVEGIDLITSESSEQVSRITLQFDLERNIDAAAQDVRDRVARVIPQLPEDAEEPLIAKYDVSEETIMWIAVVSETRSPFEIVELADKFIKPRLETVPGVGRVRVGGSNAEAMRIELDRETLAAYGLTVADVVEALERQNVEVPSGRVEGTWREFVVKTEGEFSTVEGFRSLIIRYAGGAPVRIGDVAKVRRGFENERTGANFNGKPTNGLGIVKQSRANTLAVADGVKRRLEDIRPQLPDGYTVSIAFDQSPFIERSVREVRQALIIAGILVVIVIFVFLQSARTTVIPSIVMPVAIMTTFGVIYFLGFSINNLVLMALTLVVGVVVDDAIIVLENVYRHMEGGAERTAAAISGSREITFAVIATTLTLVAVFVPIAFLGGTTGRFFYEFGVSVAVAVGASSFVALTLTPMLCSRFLAVGSTAARDGLAGRVARRFDDLITRLSERYVTLLEWALAHRRVMVITLLGAVVVSVLLFAAAGKEFVPQDDRGYFIVRISTPEGSTVAYQSRHQRAVEQLLDDTPEVRSYFSIVAISRGGPGQVNTGIMFVRLHAWNERERTANEIIGDLRRRAITIPGADVYFSQFNPLTRGASGKPVGFVVQHPDFDRLALYSEKLKAVVSEMEGLTDVDSDLDVNKPQIDVLIDRDRAGAFGVDAIDIANTLKVMLGGDTVTRFKRGNERYDVIVQLSPDYRFQPQDLRNIYVRSPAGELMPLSNVVTIEETVGPSAVHHYDRRRAVVVDANLDGIPLGEAIDRVRVLAEQVLPQDFTTTLAGESRELERSAQGLGFTFVLAVVAIYLVLAGQFESFVHPLTIMLALPLATLGALAGLNMFGMTLNVYSYIGLIMLMGLVTKNSILLVDYTNLVRSRGVDAREALLTAAKVRLRPILMTAVSTIFGILPIAGGFGPGAEGRRPLGVAVVAGMITSTLLTLVVVPTVYSMLDDLAGALRRRRERTVLARAGRGGADQPVKGR